MTPRPSSRSIRFDEEHRSQAPSKRESRRQSPDRRGSYERRRPNHDRGRRRDRPVYQEGSDFEGSDDGVIHKVDRFGRQYAPHNRRGSFSRERHDDHYDRCHRMSGALLEESSSSSTTGSPSRRPETDRTYDRWSRSEAPFKDRVRDPCGATDTRCHCRRCQEGRGGCRYEGKHWIGRNNLFTSPRSSRSSSIKPRGILKRASSESSREPRLRKSVSFEKGTKLPIDCQDEVYSGLDEYIGRSSGGYERASRKLSPDANHKLSSKRNQSPPRMWRDTVVDDRPSNKTAPNMRASTANQQQAEGQSDRPKERQDRPSRDRHTQSKPADKPSASSSDMTAGRVAYEILVATHQHWCRGDCSNRAKFARRMGACRLCRRRPRQGTVIPNCRTLIHCVNFADDFLGEPMHWIWGSNINHAIRLGHVDVYCCGLSEYLTPEEYLAYRTHETDNLDLALWIRDKEVNTRIREIKSKGAAALEGKEAGPASGFLLALSNEVERTKMLGITIMKTVRNMGGDTPDDGLIMEVVEKMIKGWTPKWVRERDE
jgi:hypothetical protein